MKKIVVVGGGTAGWLTAIFVRHIFSEDVTVIASSSIDILGAGEGSTPNLLGTLKSFNIDIDDFIKKTDSTIKAGVRFYNWDKSKLGVFDHLFNMDGNVFYGLHFNARKTADYLEKHAHTLGVKKIDGLVNSFIENSDGDIKKIILNNGSTIDCDFIFDCTGFQRLIIGNHHNSEWVSYSDKLICNKSFAFFLPQTEKLDTKTVTKTNAIAMKCGWMWKTPLQNRYGCGYVFSDKFITLEDAVNEVEDYLKTKIEIVKVFDFNPGSYKKTWINNSIALGLASGFVEPLEATSIMGLIMSIEKLMRLNIFEKNKKDIEEYNDFVESSNKQIVYFLMHHYNCGRLDTPFWRYVNSIELPEMLKKMRSDDGFDVDEVKKYFKIKNDKLIFGGKNYHSVTGGHQFKKVIKTLI